MRNSIPELITACILSPVLLTGCHRIFTGDDPTASVSTSELTAKGSLTSETIEDPSGPTTRGTDWQATEGATATGSDTFSTTQQTTPPSDTSMASDNASASASSSTDTGTGETITCDSPDPDCNPLTSPPGTCLAAPECKWNLNCNDMFINDLGKECDKMVTPPPCPDCRAKWCKDDALDEGEECNPPLIDGCDAECKWLCGNGQIDPGEECDKGPENGPAPKFCNSSCERNGLLVFVSDDHFKGDLGGKDPNVLCNSLANKKGALTKDKDMLFGAWIGYDNGLPIGPFITGKCLLQNSLSRPYYLTDETTLVSESPPPSGDLKHSIDKNQFGKQIKDSPLRAWTNINADGQLASDNNDCENWSTPMGPAHGGDGLLTETDDNWTDSSDAPCSSPARIYCFEFTIIDVCAKP